MEIMILTGLQISKLADLCIDLAKACLIAAIAGPVLESAIDLFTSLRLLFLGFFFTVVGLAVLKKKEV